MTGHTPEERDRLMVQVFMILQRIGAVLFRSDLKPEEVEKTLVQELGSIAQEAAELVLSRLRGLGDGRIIDEVISSNEIRLRPVRGYEPTLYLVRPIRPGETKGVGGALEAINKLGYETRDPFGLIPEISRYCKDLWRSRIKSVTAIDVEEESIYQLDISADETAGHQEVAIIDFTGRDWFLAVRK